MFCTNCGKALAPDERFCTNCGKATSSETSQADAPQPQTAPPPQPAAQTILLNCPFCAAALQTTLTGTEQKVLCPLCRRKLNLSADGTRLEPTGAPPASHLALGIFSTICFLPLGVTSLICGSRVKRLFRAGAYAQAARMSQIALFSGLLGILFSCLSVFPLAFLGGLLLPALNQARNSARMIACVSNSKQIVQGVMMYQNDYNGTFPQTSAQLQHYNLPSTIWSCPARGLLASDGTQPELVSYALLSGGLNLDQISQPGLLPILVEKPWLGGHKSSRYTVAFADGHVETVMLPNPDQSCTAIVEFVRRRSKPDADVPAWETVLRNARNIDANH